MKPSNWGAVSFLMMAAVVAVGMALAGTVGTVLDPVLTQVENTLAGMMGGPQTASAGSGSGSGGDPVV
jgi:hypothetical protein